MRRKIKTVMEQMNAEKPDDVLSDLESKHGCAAPTGLGDGMTLKLAEKLAKNCGYAWDAKGTKDNPINWGDASAFFLEGWLEGMRTAARVCKANAATGNEEGWTDSVSKDCMNLILDGMTPRDESLNDQAERSGGKRRSVSTEIKEQP